MLRLKRLLRRYHRSWIDPTDLYDEKQKAGIPVEAVLASLGCGNPTALAELREGETVLDLGSGGGIDVLLSAKRVGPTGKAYGLDMTDEMLALANDNKRRAGAENVEFLKGEIEQIPLPDASVDVIISNCVINLSGDKRKVLREAFRVLEPGGRFALSDVSCARVPQPLRLTWTLIGCVAASPRSRSFLAAARGRVREPVVEPTRIYKTRRRGIPAGPVGAMELAINRGIDGRVVRATKPRRCGPGCCGG